MLLDCFTFFRELDLLEGRLEYLYDVVDYFVIVEADITFAGNKKELNFLNNIKRFKPYLDKIIYQPISIDINQFIDSINVDKSSLESFNWKIEYAQRSHIDNILKLFDDDSYVIISDLDEIPLKSYLNESLKCGVQLDDSYKNECVEYIELIKSYYL
jgi:beta-1,4-mannosyl-glycoprotein beta-1,4-N-acetylglucosaminyltransferase